MRQHTCDLLHQTVNRLEEFSFPFDQNTIPPNGIYILFEKGELAHNTKRIVRIGTHTGKNQLPSRPYQHFVNENKDRSIFRKNIGRCLLGKENDPFLEEWEIDLTASTAKKKHRNSLNHEKRQLIERRVSEYIRQNFSFVVFEVEEKQKRLNLESKIISTVSLCRECSPSNQWLGLYSPKKKIRESGLWQVNELYKRPLSLKEAEQLCNNLLS